MLPCPETWDANEKLAARKNKFGEKIKKVEAVEKKIESFIDKKLKKINDSKHDKVDELKAEIQEALDKVRVVKSLSKACQTDSPVLSSVVRDLKEAKRLNLTFSRDLVQRFMLWEADEMVRLNDWKGLASLFKKTTVRHDFAVLHDGSVAALMADEENLGLTQEVALSALESHIASMMQNITSEEMAQPTARSPSLSLKNFVTALLEAAESLIAWEQLERSLGIMDVLLSPASCDVVHLENAVQAVTKYSHAELEEMEQEFAKNIMELQQESIVQILMLSSSGGILVDHAQVVAGRRRREGQLAGKVVELTQTIDDFQLHGSLDARFVAAVQATENLMAPQWKQVLTTSEKVFAKFKVQEARLFEIALKLLKEVVHKVIQTAVDKGRSTSLCITEARVVVCPLRKADMERLVADDVQEKLSQAMKEFYTNAVCDAGALSKAILIIVSGNTAEMEDALRALQSEFTSAMDGVTLHWEEFMDRLRNVCSYALDAAMITVKKTAMSWARREKPATEDTNWIVRQVSSIDTAMTALQRSSRLPTEYFSALGALAWFEHYLNGTGDADQLAGLEASVKTLEAAAPPIPEGETFEKITLSKVMETLGVTHDEYAVFVKYADTCRQVIDALKQQQVQHHTQKARKCAAATALQNIVDKQQLPSTSDDYDAFVEFMGAQVNDIVKHQQTIKGQIDEGKLDEDPALKQGRQTLVSTASSYLLVFAIVANLNKLSGKRVSQKDRTEARQALRQYSDALEAEDDEEKVNVAPFVAEACMSEAAAAKAATETKTRAKVSAGKASQKASAEAAAAEAEEEEPQPQQKKRKRAFRFPVD